MKHVVRTILVLAVMIAIQPALAKVTVDFDTEADFSAYKTYAWAEGTHATNSLMHKRIQRVVEERLELLGLTATDGDADVYVLYHVALDQDTRVDFDDFGYGRGRWRDPFPDVAVYDVRVGTLILDLLDGSSKEAVWRGMTEQDLPANPNPDKIEKRLRKILGKMFRNYPPE